MLQVMGHSWALFLFPVPCCGRVLDYLGVKLGIFHSSCVLLPSTNQWTLAGENQKLPYKVRSGGDRSARPAGARPGSAFPIHSSAQHECRKSWVHLSQAVGYMVCRLSYSWHGYTRCLKWTHPMWKYSAWKEVNFFFFLKKEFLLLTSTL